jgi:galactokinase
LRETFVATFARAPDVAASAPGRVNLLGEHTDYNGGLVLPVAIPQRTHVLLGARWDRQVQVVSATLRERREFCLGAETKRGDWSDYVQGVTRALAEHGHSFSGFDLLISSDVPLGSGLSSSAALAVAILRGLRDLFQLALDDLALARLAQWGENHVVGAPVGILDPIACHLADERTALFLDTRSLRYEKLPLPSGAELVVIDSGVSHAHADGGYGVRRSECELAARLLGVQALSDLTVADHAKYEQLSPPLNRRVRHVTTENQRVRSAVEALRRDDHGALGTLFDGSHISMRDDFEVSVPAVDALVERARELGTVYGARLTGGGFGGAVVCLVAKGHASTVGAELERAGATLLVPKSDGPAVTR